MSLPLRVLIIDPVACTISEDFVQSLYVFRDINQFVDGLFFPIYKFDNDDIIYINSTPSKVETDKFKINNYDKQLYGTGVVINVSRCGNPNDALSSIEDIKNIITFNNA